jgi:hypothetical protein
MKRAGNAIRTPFWIEISKLPEVGIGHRVFVEIEGIDGNRVFRDFVRNNCGTSMLKVFTRLGIWAASIPIRAVAPRTSTIDPTTAGAAFARCGEDSSADRFATCARQCWESPNKNARLRAGINSALLIDFYSSRET